MDGDGTATAEANGSVTIEAEAQGDGSTHIVAEAEGGRDVAQLVFDDRPDSFEERDLLRYHGEAYRQYRERLLMLIPGLR